MTAKRFITKTTVKILVYAIISTIALSVLYSPVITNELALLQMENSNAFYMIMDTCNKLRPFISISYNLITVLFVLAAMRDTCKLIETKTNKGEN